MSDLKLHYVTMDYCGDELMLMVNAADAVQALVLFRLYYELDGRFARVKPPSKLRRGEDAVKVFQITYDREKPGPVCWSAASLTEEGKKALNVIGTAECVYIGRYVETDE